MTTRRTGSVWRLKQNLQRLFRRRQGGHPSGEPGIDKPNQREHGKILAVLFILFGAAHLVVVFFVWSIVFALAHEGYFPKLPMLQMLALLGVTLSLIATPLVSAIALLRQRSWASGAVSAACLVILVAVFTVLYYDLRPGFSMTRLAIGVLYGGTNLAISVYGLWFVSRRAQAKAS